MFKNNPAKKDKLLRRSECPSEDDVLGEREEDITGAFIVIGCMLGAITILGLYLIWR